MSRIERSSFYTEDIERVFTRPIDYTDSEDKMLNDYYKTFLNKTSNFREKVMSSGLGALLCDRHPGLNVTDIEVYKCASFILDRPGEDPMSYLQDSMPLMDEVAELSLNEDIPFHVAFQHYWFSLYCQSSIEECKELMKILDIDYLTNNAVKYFGVPFACRCEAFEFDAYDVAILIYSCIYGSSSFVLSKCETILFTHCWNKTYPQLRVPSYDQVLAIIGHDRICWDGYNKLGKNHYIVAVKQIYDFLEK